MRGCDEIRSVMKVAKPSLSTARAPPAGTLFSSAAAIIREPCTRNSSLRRPTALARLTPLREFEHTSSPINPLEWAGVIIAGLISKRSTLTPLCAACHAASLPARPAPITLNLAFFI